MHPNNSELLSDSPIFVVGVPRSGTTLVRLLLNAHSRMGIATETHFLRHFWSSRLKYNNLLSDDGFLLFWKDLSRSKYFDDLNFNDKERIKEKIFRENRTFRNIFKLLMVEYAKQKGKIRWGEKTPGHLEYANVLLDFFPNCRIIHVIRDPRDVCLSSKKVPWGSHYVFSNARLWNRFMLYPRIYGLTGNPSYLEIRYEDLILHPQETIELLCHFVREIPEESMLSFYKYTNEYLEKKEPWKNEVYNPLNESNIGKWKKGLTPWEIRQINLKCEKQMLEKGYDVDILNYNIFRRLNKYCQIAIFHSIWFIRASFIAFAKFFRNKIHNFNTTSHSKLNT